MPQEALDALNPKKGDVIVDCTLGSGGHSKEILKAVTPKGRLIALDRDKEALDRTKKTLTKYAKHCSFIHADFRNVGRVLKESGVEKVNGVIFDLGLSSEQLEDPERGFAFAKDGPLDMRFDRHGKCLCAYDLVNCLTETEIDHLLFEFGQERWHRRIARNIVTQRKKKAIATTHQLKNLVSASIPARYRRGRIHPATRTFQALRIAVNQELAALDAALNDVVGLLKPGGRICVISFHSLEDRIVKRKFKALSQAQEIDILTKRPARPSRQEVLDNPRSRSAMLRCAEKLGPNRG